MKRYLVELDADLADLVPDFLDNRAQELARLHRALEQGDMTAIGKIGHNLKGVAGSYGFVDLADLGAQLQAAAGHADRGRLDRLLQLIGDYLDRIEVRYA